MATVAMDTTDTGDIQAATIDDRALILVLTSPARATEVGIEVEWSSKEKEQPCVETKMANRS